MPEIIRRFWAWYGRNYTLNVGIIGIFFLWQLVHLYWLGADVMAERLFGVSYFDPSPFWQFVLVIVDYTEIPAIVSTSLLYLFELQKKFSWRALGLLTLLNSQWLHLFWLTDEFVVRAFQGVSSTVLPVWLAWIAIMIDYLELPVIFDIMRRFLSKLLGYEDHQPSLSK